MTMIGIDEDRDTDRDNDVQKASKYHLYPSRTNKHAASHAPLMLPSPIPPFSSSIKAPGHPISKQNLVLCHENNVVFDDGIQDARVPQNPKGDATHRCRILR